MGKPFLTKNVGKTAGARLGKVACTSLGYLIAAYGSNVVIRDRVKPELHGPGALVFGGAGTVMIENEYARSVAEGVFVFGAHRTVGDHILKEKKADVGLAGVGASWEELAKMNGIGESYSFAEIQKLLNGIEGDPDLGDTDLGDPMDGFEDPLGDYPMDGVDEDGVPL